MLECTEWSSIQRDELVLQAWGFSLHLFLFVSDGGVGGVFKGIVPLTSWQYRGFSTGFGKESLFCRRGVQSYGVLKNGVLTMVQSPDVCSWRLRPNRTHCATACCMHSEHTYALGKTN